MEQLRQNLTELVAKYRHDHANLSEADVRANYIDQLFLYLGWDVWGNDSEHRTRYQREAYIRGTGRVDVGLEIAGYPVLLLEAKRFGTLVASAKRTYDRTLEEKQLFRYARSKKIPYCILTNFERLQVFNADHERLVLWFDGPSEYLDRLSELLRLSPEKVEAGSLAACERQLEIKDIDEAFLISLQAWRSLLANTIYEHNLSNSVLQSNDEFDFTKLMAAVQRILDRLILIRYADDKEVLLTYDVIEGILSSYHRKGSYARPGDLTHELIEFCHRMDEHHNTTLFQPGHICEQVYIPDEVLERIMGELNSISFRKFTSDILGNTYETYLGTKLVLRNEEIKSEQRKDIRKGGGIYYTPTTIVHYIIDNTLGQVLTELEENHGLHAIEKAKNIKILDPACGSGSFLIRAYRVLADFYRRISDEVQKERTRVVTAANGPDLFQSMELLKQLPEPFPDYPHHILEKQLYGVDIDAEAAEIAAVNLTMQAFADARREKLPLILNENIKVGNSLISGGESELRHYFGDDWARKKPFSWQLEFPDVMDSGGFDIIVGNPPWISNDNLDEKEKELYKKAYEVAVGRFDIAGLFAEKGIELLNESGILSFVMPEHVWLGEYFVPFRAYLANNTRVMEILSFKEGSFAHTANPCSTFLVRKARQSSTLQTVKLGSSDGGESVTSFQVETDIIPRVIFDEFSHKLVRKVQNLGYVTLGQTAMVTDGIQTANLLSVLFTQNPREEVQYNRALRSGKSILFRYAPVKWQGWWVLKPEYTREFSRPGFSYDSPKRMKCFRAKEKIILRQTEPTILATIDKDGYYFPNSIFQVALEKKDEKKIKWLLAILNSKFLRLFYSKLSQVEGTTKPQIYLNLLKSLPIPTEVESALPQIVDQILDVTKDDDYLSDPAKQAIVKELEGQIDQMVYKLYRLTPEEIRVVEASLP